MINENSLVSRNPEAAEMYDNEKNEALGLPDASVINYNSSKRAHFRCLKYPEHEFTEIINRMTRADGSSAGCKICNKIAKSAKLFIEACPIGGEWWDKDRNELLLGEVSCYDVNFAYFICPEGHSFEKRISSFFQTPKCPECEKIKNSIEKRKPHLVPFFDTEANSQKANQIKAFSKDDVNWKCPCCEYRWVKPPKKIRDTQGKCPKCGYKPKLSAGISFFEFNPEASKKWIKDKNGKNTPHNILYNERTVIHLQCPENNNHIISKQAFRIPRTYPYGCTLCTSKEIKKEESFAALCPELIQEFDYENNNFLPEEISEVSTKNTYWVCKNNTEHRWSSKIVERARGRGNCPFCKDKPSGFSERHKFLKPFFDEKANGITFEKVTEKGNPEYWFNCEKRHHYKSRITNFSSKLKYECRVCNGSVVLAGKTDLESQYPKVAKEYSESNPKKAREISIYNTNPDTAWECSLGHRYRCSVFDRLFNYKGCRKCNKKIDETVIIRQKHRESELVSNLYPEVRDIYDNDLNSKSVDEIKMSDVRSYIFKCEYGHSYSATISSVINEGFNCQVCSGKKLQIGENSLYDKYPKLVKKKWSRAKNYILGDPNRILPNCSNGFWWDCPECSNSFYMAPNKYLKKYVCENDDYDDNKGCLYCKGLRRDRTYII